MLKKQIIATYTLDKSNFSACKGHLPNDIHTYKTGSISYNLNTFSTSVNATEDNNKRNRLNTKALDFYCMCY